jgi:hypothetical protein
MTSLQGIPQEVDGPRKRVDMGSTEPATLGGSGALADSELRRTNAAVEAAIAEAAAAANPRKGSAALPGNPLVDPPVDPAAGPGEAEQPPSQ